MSLICIYAAGALTMLVAILHTRFYRMFGWRSEFGRMTAVNAKILYTIHTALLLLFFLIGGLTIGYANELSRSTGMAFGFNLGLSLFWLWRLVWQLIYFRGPRDRKLPMTAIMFTAIFLFQFILYLVPVVYPVQL